MVMDEQSAAARGGAAMKSAQRPVQRRRRKGAADEMGAALIFAPLGLDFRGRRGAAVLAGIMFIYSASYRGGDHPVGMFYERQIVWAFLGLLCFFGAAAFDYHQLRDGAGGLYAVAVILLVLVL
jgi:cell division protein FtsW (lipid II flippase)